MDVSTFSFLTGPLWKQSNEKVDVLVSLTTDDRPKIYGSAAIAIGCVGFLFLTRNELSALFRAQIHLSLPVQFQVTRVTRALVWP
jgi:hypothetical protein